MSWDAIGAIAELVGATAVVLTLLYLARETAKNSKSVDATSSRAIALHTSAFNAEIARDPVLTGIFLKSYQLEEQEYSEEEWFKFFLAATSLMQTWQAQIMHGNLGLGDQEEVRLNVDFTSGLIHTFPAWDALGAVGKTVSAVAVHEAAHRPETVYRNGLVVIRTLLLGWTHKEPAKEA